jgi:hypothetical protein
MTEIVMLYDKLVTRGVSCSAAREACELARKRLCEEGACRLQVEDWWISGTTLPGSKPHHPTGYRIEVR